MDDVRYAKIQAVFEGVIGLSRSERIERLDELCGGDAALRADVERFVAAAEQTFGAGSPLSDEQISALRAEMDRVLDEESATLGSVGLRPATGSLTVGDEVDRYRLLERIGEGGFGTVWMAEQREPVRRRVALKIIKLGMDTKQVIARFEAERQALALMDHPNIAKVFDAGATEAGRPYFAMEYIAGVPIIEYCDKERLDTVARLKLFAEVCRAIQHAHQKGIIHRDIKPSNVLVMMQDGRPVPKVIDFGIAKATNAELTQRTFFTEQRQVIGTPAYMSPEQAEMSALDIDTRADIYSLGVLLYELLTGTTPFEERDLLSKGFAEMMRIIRETDPQRPSTRLSSLGETAGRTAQLRRSDAKRLCSSLRGDLDWIVMKCLEKDRTRRYETASGLAADIQRHLNNEPVEAGPPGAAYRIGKFVRRNRGGVIAGGIIAAVVVLGFAGTLIGLVEAQRQRELAEQSAAREMQRADELQRVTEFQAEQLVNIDPSGMGERMRASLLERAPDDARDMLGEALGGVNFTSYALDTLNENLLQETIRAIDEAFADQPAVRGQLLHTTADVMQSLGLLDEAVEPLRRALEIRREALGDEHPDTLASMTNLGYLLSEVGRYDEAEPLCREAMAGRREVLGEDHEDTLNSVSIMGVVLQAAGRVEEAEAYYLEALEGWERTLGPDDSRTLTATNNYGYLLASQGKRAESEPYYRKALEGRRRVLGEDHPHTLTTMSNLGLTLMRLGRGDEAEPFYLGALEGRRRTLGDEHPSTLASLNNVGGMYRDRGEYDKAAEYFELTLEGLRAAMGPDHPHAIYSLGNLAAAKRGMGDLEGAEPLFKEAAARAREVFPDTHEYRWRSLGELGDVRARRGDFAGAVGPLTEAYEGFLESRGPEYRQTIAGARRLMHCYRAWHEREPDAGYDELEAKYRALLPGDE